MCKACSQPTQIEVLFSPLYNPHRWRECRVEALKQIAGTKENQNAANARLETHYFCGQWLGNGR